MLYLADTVQRRGRLFHSELNLPVYQSLQNLSFAVSVSFPLQASVHQSDTDVSSRPMVTTSLRKA
jgi:hypothetical protein